MQVLVNDCIYMFSTRVKFCSKELKQGDNKGRKKNLRNAEQHKCYIYYLLLIETALMLSEETK